MLNCLPDRRRGHLLWLGGGGKIESRGKACISRGFLVRNYNRKIGEEHGKERGLWGLSSGDDKSKDFLEVGSKALTGGEKRGGVGAWRVEAQVAW